MLTSVARPSDAGMRITIDRKRNLEDTQQHSLELKTINMFTTVMEPHSPALARGRPPQAQRRNGDPSPL